VTQRLEGRTNLVTSREEHWRPPSYVAEAGLKTELRSRLLRFFDLLGEPVVVALVVIANETMVFQGAVDFLGFWVTAKRPG